MKLEGGILRLGARAKNDPSGRVLNSISMATDDKTATLCTLLRVKYIRPVFSGAAIHPTLRMLFKLRTPLETDTFPTSFQYRLDEQTGPMKSHLSLYVFPHVVV